MTIIRKIWRENICYKALWMILLLLMLVPYLHQELAPLAKIFLIWGYGYIIYDLVTERILWRRRSLFLLLGFCLSYVITILFHREEGFSTNLRALLYMGMMFILLCGGWQRREVRQKEQKILVHTMLAVTSLLALCCLGTFFLNISGSYQMSGGSLGYLGMIDGRLWGLYNANTGGALNAISILSLLFLMRKKEDINRRCKVFYIASLAVHICCLALSGSRTALYSLLAVLSLSAYLWMPLDHWMKSRRKPGRIRLFLLRMLAAVILFMAGYAGNALTGALLQAIPRGEVRRIEIMQETDSGRETDAESAEGTPEALDGAAHQAITSPVRGDGGILTGRPILWEAGIRTFQKYLFFGTTREAMISKTVPELSNPEWEPDLTAGGVHNGYLTVLICSGIVGSMFLLAYAVVVIRKLRENPGERIVIAMLLLFLIMELMEARILYQTNFFLFWFWLFVGYLPDGKEAS